MHAPPTSSVDHTRFSLRSSIEAHQHAASSAAKLRSHCYNMCTDVHVLETARIIHSGF